MKTLRQCTDRQEWDDYILDNGGHPLQLWGWGDVKAGKNWKVDRLFLTDDGPSIIGAAQILIRRLPWPMKSLAYVPRGPVVGEGDRQQLIEELAGYAKKVYKSVVLKIEPDNVEFLVPKGWVQSKNPILPSSTIILDLKKTEDVLLSEMAKKTRQYIRKSASDVIIKRLHARADLDECLDIYRETAKRAKFNLHSDQYYYDVFSDMGDNSVLFAAYSNNKPVAFLWLAISASTAFELYGGMNGEGQQLRANYALKWHAISKCKEWGILRYDFGGLVEGGVSTFKMGWASEDVKLVGTFDKPLSILYGVLSGLLPIIKSILHRLTVILKQR
jgi:lipid II:glycine glycyltransferase (peptidoglycan interpeptide bridge formation enzyme)